MTYAITVFEIGDRNGRTGRVDIAFYTNANSTPEMEDTVTDLHKRFPPPLFDVEVKAA
jgi:hypothetical protein